MKARKILVSLSQRFQSWVETHGFTPELLLGLIVLLIATINYTPGTWLSGWDNLHPEFNFSLNIKRSFQAVWQEYQGVGLLGGMGHASDLPRQLFLWLCSLLIPKSFLRYFYIYLTLLIGPLGVYYLVKNLFKKDKITAFLSAIFYLLNLATVQTFYFPFSAFATHFAFLPWLILFFLKYLSEGRKESLFYFFLFGLLVVPQAYIPTIFVVYILALMALTLPYLFQNRDQLKQISKRLGILIVIIFSVNAFWLLPQIYFTFKNSHLVTEAKMNQMATQENFLKNQKYGDLKNVALLKSFWFENTDISPSGRAEYTMSQWRAHLDKPFIRFLGYGLFCLAIFGLVSPLFKKDPSLRKERVFPSSFALISLLSFTMIASKTPPFSLIVSLFREHLPFFAQIFRLPFTKFSTLLSLSLAVFFGLGIKNLIEFFPKIHFLSFFSTSQESRSLSRHLRGVLRLFSNRKLYISSVFLTSLIIFTLPVFQGYLFYPRLKVKIPEEYFELFDWFEKQDPNARIANFPQYQFWGWNWYRFGYTGSGFLWYALPQPILDRAFDTWSDKNEGYFWEISQAIYSENLPLLENLIDKYQIKYLLLDKNIMSPGNQKALNLAALERMFENSQKISLVQKFGQVEVYEAKNGPEFKNFITLLALPPEISPAYKWANIDTAFIENGFYTTSTTHNGSTELAEVPQPTTYYPFRSLFTNNGFPENLEIKGGQVSTTPEPEQVRYTAGVQFRASLPALGITALNLPNFALKEKVIPVGFQSDEERKILKLNPLLPKIEIGEKEVRLEAKSIEIPLPKEIKPYDFLFTLNQEKFGDSGYVFTDRPNEVHFFQKTPKITLSIGPENFKDEVSRCAVQKVNEEFDLEKDEEKITLKGKMSASCVSLKIPLDFISPGDLVKISFAYKSDQDEIPIFCLYSEERKSCLNQKEKKAFGYSYEWKSFEDYTVAVISPSDRIDFRLMLDAYDQESLKAISYKEIKIEVYPSLGREKISLDPQDFSQEQQEIELAQPTVFSVTLPSFEGLLNPPEAIQNHQFGFKAENCAPFGSQSFGKEVQTTGNKETTITYQAKDSVSCDHLVYDFLLHDLAYLLSFETKSLSGLPFRVYTTNHQTQHTDLLTYFFKSKDWQTQNLVLPPYEPVGKGYTLTLENVSFNEQKTENQLSQFKIQPFPFSWLKAIRLGTHNSQLTTHNSSLPFEAKKRALFWYQVNVPKIEKESLLVLSQGFDSGWAAFLGRKRLPHILVNNWESGWIIENSKLKTQNSKLNIFYLPQILEFMGFAFLFWIICYLAVKIRSTSPKPDTKNKKSTHSTSSGLRLRGRSDSRRLMLSKIEASKTHT